MNKNNEAKVISVLVVLSVFAVIAVVLALATLPALAQDDGGYPVGYPIYSGYPIGYPVTEPVYEGYPVFEGYPVHTEYQIEPLYPVITSQSIQSMTIDDFVQKTVKPKHIDDCNLWCVIVRQFSALLARMK